jgi:hypothetical protein
MIYRRTMKEAKRRENDKYIGNAKNKTGAMWRIINKKLRSNPKREMGEEISCGTWKGSNLKDIAEMYVLRRIFGPKRDEVTGEWRK